MQPISDPEEFRYAQQLSALNTSLSMALIPYSTCRGYMFMTQYQNDVKQASIFVYEILKAFTNHQCRLSPQPDSQFQIPALDALRRPILTPDSKLSPTAASFLEDVVNEGTKTFLERQKHC